MEKAEVQAIEEEIEKPVDKPKPILKEISSKEVKNRVALLTLENLSDNKNALKHVMPVLLGQLEKKGLEVVDEDSLNNFLCKERVRATGYVSKELAGKIKKEFKAKNIVAGSIISFSTGENPKFGILARLIDSSDGGILWADYASATGDDFVTIFGLGKVRTIFSLIPRVMDKLFASFSIEGLHREIEPSYRVAVMPFQNDSDFKNAGIIAMYMFTIELLKNQKFEPIEYGNIRNLIVSLRIRNRGDLNYKNISAFSEQLGASGILLGVVDNYKNGMAVSSSPKVGMSARLLDGRTNKILWYNSHQLSGEENIIVFDWGRIRSVHTVASKVASNLVKKMGTTKWH
jgi:TolB-like protein